MNGRQARGCGMSAHDRVKTSTKKTANSIVGKLTAGILASGAGVSEVDLRVPPRQVLVQRLPHLLPFAGQRHPVPAQQLLLALQRQPGDLPPHHQPLEQELHAPLPPVLSGGRRLGVEVGELAQCSLAERAAQREASALLVAVILGRRRRGRGLLAPPGAPPASAAHRAILATAAEAGRSARLRRRPHRRGRSGPPRSARPAARAPAPPPPPRRRSPPPRSPGPLG